MSMLHIVLNELFELKMNGFIRYVTENVSYILSDGDDVWKTLKHLEMKRSGNDRTVYSFRISEQWLPTDELYWRWAYLIWKIIGADFSVDIINALEFYAVHICCLEYTKIRKILYLLHFKADVFD